ncbi:hypothetical protein N566_05305, partial [Streptomycetaceae bacterium MP113-05]
MSQAHDPFEPSDGHEPADGAGSDPARPDAAVEPGSRPGTETETEPAADGDSGLDLEQMDEVAVRRLLRDSVRDIEPSPGTLEHLRHAVPARRARRRNAMVGAAAAVLACGVAVPTVLHADFVPGVGKPMHTAGHAEDHVTQEERAAGGDQGDGSDGRDAAEPGWPGAGERRVEAGAPSTGSSSAPPDASSSLGPLSPSCTRMQLGDTTGSHRPPDGQGHVYGAFRVVNTSSDSCTVDGDGLVLVTTQGSTDDAMINVLDHTTGDVATGLPDPFEVADEVVLEPGAAYLVRFVWVPAADQGCPTSTSPPGGEGGDGAQPGGQTPMGTSGSQADPDAGGSSGTSGSEGGEGRPGTGPTEGPADGGAGDGGAGTGETDGGGSTAGGATGGGATG